MSTEGGINPTVILVEDDPLLGSILVDVLQAEGHDSVLFENADDALVSMLKYGDQVRLVISDYSTPGQLNGIELSELILSRWPFLPFILMSGHDLGTLPSLPVNVQWLAKPWNVSNLLTMVDAAFATEPREAGG
jgi:DNA-binding NtrC family response regulator